MQKTNTHRAGSSSHSRKSDKHKWDRPANKPSSSNQGVPPLRFLFVINRLTINYWEKDLWDNPRPPEQSSGYDAEDPSDVVLRFQDGVISKASNFMWWRPQPGEAGSIFYCTAPDVVHPIDMYRTTTVFSCSPHLPIVATNQDASVHPQLKSWYALKFMSLDHLRGVSVAILDQEEELVVEMEGRDPVKQVVGKHAKWMPSLVPDSYKQPPGSSAPKSHGLTGNLNVLLGLMALSVDPTAATAHNFQRVFSSSQPRFSNFEWHHSGDFVGYSGGSPHGALVWIGLDPADANSTEENIMAFERGRGTFVKG